MGREIVTERQNQKEAQCRFRGEMASRGERIKDGGSDAGAESVNEKREAGCLSLKKLAKSLPAAHMLMETSIESVRLACGCGTSSSSCSTSKSCGCRACGVFGGGNDRRTRTRANTIG